MRIVLVLVVACSLPALAGADTPKVVPAAEAGRHVDEVVTVEVPVRSTGSSRKEGFVFLNSHENFRSNDNFTLVFTPTAQAAFRAAGIENIEKHYFRQLIRVTGKVRHFKSVTDIQVERPDQITVVGPVTGSPAPPGRPAAASAPTDAPPAAATGPSTEFVIGAVALGVFGLGLGVFGASRFVARKPAAPEPEGTSAAPAA
ncbi:Uncharacterized protein OS=Singulisphaera acidiphila (strain ATCC BAA-1392 / DSM 18658 / VKM B-2454 / MOB10) GN=Sinac_0209 PE=4 SV=1 [Gemmataceae bacterium]|nr:Uncharacterized protein OS=Singulisphaera acidiphila (strain ATCC BAA-1392 / DSM 18658 / VKM B-2454 / MOB10) GN=Sinac_0209 PE=4 SV=1 [Gemmataceae bacterium]VTT98232.1 Uncharacterized protein OS=Singulisphaera acidiphila (strain ATCC BAA-1392 / DSM 18658 / VKM B-2454 / MOB10) GN=Sinac_0209 PE=4 SV=1 [Gemmataceae bacterium]